MSEYDTIIRDGYVQEHKAVVDIGITGNEIRAVEPELDGTADHVIDAEKNLVTPSFTDCHMHNDRSHSICGDRHPVDNEYEPDATGLRRSYTHEGFDEHFADLTTAELTENIVRDIQGAVANGTGYVRSHVILDHVDDTKIMEANLRAREKLKDVVDVQLVPMIVGSLLENEEARELLFEAIEMGLDRMDPEDLLLGGIGTGSNEGKHVDRTIDEWFTIASRYDLDIDVHIQDHGSLGVYTIEQLIDGAKRHGYEGRITGSHCYALADVPPEWEDKLIELMNDVDMDLTTCFSSTPCEWPMRKLLDGGIPIGHGTDNTHDYIMPYGVSDSIQGAMIESVKLTHFEAYGEDIHYFQSNQGLQDLWGLITHKGASVLGVDSQYGIEAGNAADLAVLTEPSQEWAITRQADCRYVLKNGTTVVRDGTIVESHDQLA